MFPFGHDAGRISPRAHASSIPRVRQRWAEGKGQDQHLSLEYRNALVARINAWIYDGRVGRMNADSRLPRSAAMATSTQTLPVLLSRSRRAGECSCGGARDLAVAVESGARAGNRRRARASGCAVIACGHLGTAVGDDMRLLAPSGAGDHWTSPMGRRRERSRRHTVFHPGHVWSVGYRSFGRVVAEPAASLELFI